MRNRTERAAYQIWDYLLFVGIAAAFLAIVYTNLFHYQYKMNADIASEAVLTKLISESGEWIPRSWYASTELRIFGTPNLASLFYELTENMSIAMGLACILMTLGVGISGYFFSAQCEFSRTQQLAFVLLCFLIPNHFVTLELFYLWAGYYSIHVIILFFSLGVYARILKRQNWIKIDYLLMLLAIVFSFAMGMQGTRNILILSGPLFVVQAVRILCHIFRKDRDHKKESVVLLWSFLLLMAGCLGTKTGYSVGQEISRNIRKGLWKLGEVVVPDVAKCIGFTESNLLMKGLLFLLFFLMLIDFVLILKKVVKKKEILIEDWLMLFFIGSPCMTAVFVAFTTVESSERYYFLFLYAIVFTIVKWVKNSTKVLEIGGYCLILFWFIGNIGTIYLPIWRNDNWMENENYKVVCYLEEHDYTTAYASFENANTMTVLSNGKVTVAPVATVKNMDICKWLSSNDWYVPNVPFEEKTAYIITETEKENFEEFMEDHQGKIRFEVQIGKFLIYISDYNFSQL